MYFDVLSMVLGGLGLSQGASSSKGQTRILEELSKISAAITEDEGVDRFLPEKLWDSWKDSLQDHTVLVVTGCHQFAEAFDRPCAYALKFKLDHLGAARKQEPLHSLVLGDLWFEKKESDLGHRPLVISIGGPVVNKVSERIVDRGEVIQCGKGWSVCRHQNRVAVFGDDPKDTLSAVQAFVDLDLEAFANEIW